MFFFSKIKIQFSAHITKTIAVVAIFLFFAGGMSALPTIVSAGVNDSCAFHEDCTDEPNLVCEAKLCKGTRNFGCAAAEECAAGFICQNGVCSQDFGKRQAASLQLGEEVGDLNSFIQRIVNIALGFLALMGIIIVMYGGYVWMMARGSEEKVTEGKKIILAAAIGLIIILISWTITSYLLTLGRRIGGEGGPPPEIKPFPASFSRELEADPFLVSEIATAHPADAENLNNKNVYTCSDLSIEFNHTLGMTEVDFQDKAKNNPGFAIRRPSVQDIYWDEHNTENGSWEMWPNSINFTHAQDKKFPTSGTDENARRYELQIPKTLTDFYQKVLQRCKQGLGPADGVDGGCTEEQDRLIWQFQVNPDADASPDKPQIVNNYPQNNDRFVPTVPNIQLWFNVPLYLGSILTQTVDSDGFPIYTVNAENIKIFKLSQEDQRTHSFATFEDIEKAADVGELVTENWNVRADTYYDAKQSRQLTDLKFVYKDITQPLESFTWYGMYVQNAQNLCHQPMSSADRFFMTFRTSNVTPGIDFKYPQPGSFYSCPDTEVFVRFKTTMYDIATGSCKVDAEESKRGYVTKGDITAKIDPITAREFQVEDDFHPGQILDNQCKKYSFVPVNGFLDPLGNRQENRSINGKIITEKAHEPYTINFATHMNVLLDEKDAQSETALLGTRPSTDWLNPPEEKHTEGEWQFATMPFFIDEKESCVKGPYIEEVSPPEGGLNQCVSILGRNFGEGAGIGVNPSVQDDRVNAPLYTKEGADKETSISFYSNKLKNPHVATEDNLTDRWRDNSIILTIPQNNPPKQWWTIEPETHDQLKFSVAFQKQMKGVFESAIDLSSNQSPFTFQLAETLNSNICLYDLTPQKTSAGFPISATGTNFVVQKEGAQDGEGKANLKQMVFTPAGVSTTVDVAEGTMLDIKQELNTEHDAYNIFVPMPAQTGTVYAVDATMPQGLHSNALPFTVLGTDVVFNTCNIERKDVDVTSPSANTYNVCLAKPSQDPPKINLQVELQGAFYQECEGETDDLAECLTVSRSDPNVVTDCKGDPGNSGIVGECFSLFQCGEEKYPNESECAAGISLSQATLELSHPAKRPQNVLVKLKGIALENTPENKWFRVSAKKELHFENDRVWFFKTANEVTEKCDLAYSGLSLDPVSIESNSGSAGGKTTAQALAYDANCMALNADQYAWKWSSEHDTLPKESGLVNLSYLQDWGNPSKKAFTYNTCNYSVKFKKESSEGELVNSLAVPVGEDSKVALEVDGETNPVVTISWENANSMSIKRGDETVSEGNITLSPENNILTIHGVSEDAKQILHIQKADNPEVMKNDLRIIVYNLTNLQFLSDAEKAYDTSATQMLCANNDVRAGGTVNISASALVDEGAPPPGIQPLTVIYNGFGLYSQACKPGESVQASPLPYYTSSVPCDEFKISVLLNHELSEESRSAFANPYNFQICKANTLDPSVCAVGEVNLSTVNIDSYCFDDGSCGDLNKKQIVIKNKPLQTLQTLITWNPLFSQPSNLLAVPPSVSKAEPAYYRVQIPQSDSIKDTGGIPLSRVRWSFRVTKTGKCDLKNFMLQVPTLDPHRMDVLPDTDKLGVPPARGNTDKFQALSQTEGCVEIAGEGSTNAVRQWQIVDDQFRPKAGQKYLKFGWWDDLNTTFNEYTGVTELFKSSNPVHQTRAHSDVYLKAFSSNLSSFGPYVDPTFVYVTSEDETATAQPKQIITGCVSDTDCVSGYCTDKQAQCVAGVCLPVITSLTPDNGAPLTWVTLRGCHFGETEGAVKFGSVSAVLVKKSTQFPNCADTAWFDDHILAVSPLPSGKSAKVSIARSDGVPSFAEKNPLFTGNSEIYPGICRLDPSTQKLKQPIKIYGQNLGIPTDETAPGSVIFKRATPVGADLCAPVNTTWKADKVCAVVPEEKFLQQADVADVYVKMNDSSNKQSNPLEFRVGEEGLKISSQTPKGTGVCLNRTVQMKFNKPVQKIDLDQKIKVYTQKNLLTNSDFNEADPSKKDPIEPYKWSIFAETIHYENNMFTQKAGEKAGIIRQVIARTGTVFASGERKFVLKGEKSGVTALSITMQFLANDGETVVSGTTPYTRIFNDFQKLPNVFSLKFPAAPPDSSATIDLNAHPEAPYLQILFQIDTDEAMGGFIDNFALYEDTQAEEILEWAPAGETEQDIVIRPPDGENQLLRARTLYTIVPGGISLESDLEKYLPGASAPAEKILSTTDDELDCFGNTCIWQFLTDDVDHVTAQKGACLDIADSVVFRALVPEVVRGRQTALVVQPKFQGVSMFDQTVKWEPKQVQVVDQSSVDVLSFARELKLQSGPTNLYYDTLTLAQDPQNNYSQDIRPLPSDPVHQYGIDPDPLPHKIGGSVAKVFDAVYALPSQPQTLAAVDAKMYTETSPKTTSITTPSGFVKISDAVSLEGEPFSKAERSVTVYDYVNVASNAPIGENVCVNTQISFSFNQPIARETIQQGAWLFTSDSACPIGDQDSEIVLAQAPSLRGFLRLAFAFVRKFIPFARAEVTEPKFFNDLTSLLGGLTTACNLDGDYLENGHIAKPPGENDAEGGKIAAEWNQDGAPVLSMYENGTIYAQRVVLDEGQSGGIVSSAMTLQNKSYRVTGKITKSLGNGLAQIVLKNMTTEEEQLGAMIDFSSHANEEAILVNFSFQQSGDQDKQLIVRGIAENKPGAVLEFLIDDFSVKGDYFTIYETPQGTSGILNSLLKPGTKYALKLSNGAKSTKGTLQLPDLDQSHLYYSTLADSKAEIPQLEKSFVRIPSSTPVPAGALKAIQDGDFLWGFTVLNDIQSEGGICEFERVEIISPSRALSNTDTDFDVQKGNYTLRRPDYIQSMQDPLNSSKLLVHYKLTDEERTFRALARSKEGYVLAPVDEYTWTWKWSEVPDSKTVESITPPLKGADTAVVRLGNFKQPIHADRVINTPGYSGEYPVDVDAFEATSGTETLTAVATISDIRTDTQPPPKVGSVDVSVTVCYKLWSFADGEGQLPYFPGVLDDGEHDDVDRYYYHNENLNYKTQYCIQESSAKTIRPALFGLVTDSSVVFVKAGEEIRYWKSDQTTISAEQKILQKETGRVLGRPVLITDKPGAFSLPILKNYNFNFPEFKDELGNPLDIPWGFTIRVTVYANPENKSLADLLKDTTLKTGAGEPIDGYETLKSDDGNLYFVNVINIKHANTDEEALSANVFEFNLSKQGDAGGEVTNTHEKDFRGVFDEFLANMKFNINAPADIPIAQYPESFAEARGDKDVPFISALRRDMKRIIDFNALAAGIGIQPDGSTAYPLISKTTFPQGLANSVWTEGGDNAPWQYVIGGMGSKSDSTPNYIDPINLLGVCAPNTSYYDLSTCYIVSEYRQYIREHLFTDIRASQYLCMPNSYAYQYEIGLNEDGQSCYIQKKNTCNGMCVWNTDGPSEPPDNAAQCFPKSDADYRLYMNFEYNPGGWCRGLNGNEDQCEALKFCEYNSDMQQCLFRNEFAQPVCALGQHAFDVMYDSGQ
ncbi:MAG: hypothetical protein UW24_C0005G0036 [Parcubacteria group bacterium GW2011_GWA2_44_12]|nr:MAG: hypothetical protein UW24_C0005G0036 [Parcubacteria group bacterium GW2011_GWA2_44_12]